MRRSSSPELATAGIPPGRFNPLADTSLSAVVAGFVAMMTGYTSSLVLMFQAGQAAHLTNAQISSWIWALSIGMALCTIGLSLRFRAPIVIAWSTPGAALLVSSLPHVPYAEVIGAFIVCALLLTVVGLTGWFDTLMKKIPAGIAAALLAGRDRLDHALGKCDDGRTHGQNERQGAGAPLPHDAVLLHVRRHRAFS